MSMNLKAVAGAIRSKKTPLALKQGLIKKYGSQLKKEFGDRLPEALENPKKKTIKELSVFDKHQLAIARKTLSYSDIGASIMGGMTKDEAREVIKKLTGKSPMENPLAKWETPTMHKKVKRCVKKVAKKGVKSPYAVCKASVKKSINHNPAGNWYNGEATWKGQMNFLTTTAINKERAKANFMKQMADKLNLSVAFVTSKYNNGTETIEIFSKSLIKSNPAKNKEKYIGYIGKEVTLDGKPAKISGGKLKYGIVAQYPNGSKAEYSWTAIRRIHDAGGRFKTNPKEHIYTVGFYLDPNKLSTFQVNATSEYKAGVKAKKELAERGFKGKFAILPPGWSEFDKTRRNPVKWYFGPSKTSGITVVFKSNITPTEKTHGDKYKYVTGPYKTLKLATQQANYSSYGKVIKANPGAAWHEKEQHKALKAMKESKTEGMKNFESGKAQAHLISKRKSKELGMKNNPPKGAVKIYDKIEEIKAQKGKDSCWPKEHFKHSFKGKSEGAIYGMPDGSLLIKGNKPLWKNFNYPAKTRRSK